MTDTEIRDAILEKTASEYQSLIEVVVDGIFDQYSEDDLDEIGAAFTANMIDTAAICRHKRPK